MKPLTAKLVSLLSKEMIGGHVSHVLGWARLQSALVLCSNDATAAVVAASLHRWIEGMWCPGLELQRFAAAALCFLLFWTLTCRQQSSSLRSGSHLNPS